MKKLILMFSLTGCMISRGTLDEGDRSSLSSECADLCKIVIAPMVYWKNDKYQCRCPPPPPDSMTCELRISGSGFPYYCKPVFVQP